MPQFFGIGITAEIQMHMLSYKLIGGHADYPVFSVPLTHNTSYICNQENQTVPQLVTQFSCHLAR